MDLALLATLVAAVISAAISVESATVHDRGVTCNTDSDCPSDKQWCDNGVCENRVFKKFNEACCEEKGVPYDCMGLCREKNRSKRSVQYPVDKCVEHQQTIKDCMYEEAINCEWAAWVNGTCSKKCGDGTRTNTRTKLVVENNHGTCHGQDTHTESCNPNPCPIDCQWNEWNIGSCTKTCGYGQVTKKRTPKVKQDHGGQNCSGSSTITTSCNEFECPVDCVWGAWKYGECSQKCGGGVKNATRKPIQESDFGGKPCEGEEIEEVTCNKHNCPVDCVWGNWKYGECSQTCGGGVQNATRTRIQESDFGGKPCEGKAIDEVTCNNQNCPAIHCKWDAWVHGECSATCGTGTRKNTRTKLVIEANGGTCDGLPTEIEKCNPNPCPIDCVWDDWKIGKCDKNCGGGLRINKRVPKVDGDHGGVECTGNRNVTESCNVQECPVDCEWGEWVIGDCSTTCGDGHQTAIREKLQEEDFGGKPCEGTATREEECNLKACPVDCQWDEWKEGVCSKTCGEGHRTNIRSRMVKADHGGNECSGDSEYTESCNEQECQAIIKFNDTCCVENGVPEECMGLCREKVNRREEVYPIDRCVEHRSTIRTCMYDLNTGYPLSHFLQEETKEQQNEGQEIEQTG